jgi:porphobilinogen synthase
MRIRPRRNRASNSVRGMVRETRLSLEQLVYPLFLLEDKQAVQPILSMPGISRFGLEKLMVEVDECMNAGVTNFILFPAVDERHKDKYATYSLDASNFYLTAIRELKKRFPEAVFISDVAMDPYSSDGHDGLVID